MNGPEDAVADEQGFDAGFNDDAPTETPATVEEQQEAKAPPVEYAQLTKAEYEDLKARAALVDEIKATQDKSFGTFGRTIKGLQDQVAAFSNGSGVEIDQADIDALREDFPPLAAALEKVRNLRAIPTGGIDQNAIGELVQQRLAPAVQEAERRMELRMLAREHPDYATVDQDPRFKAWIGAQPADFQQGLAQASASYDSVAVGQALTKFKASLKAPAPSPQQRQSRMQAAVTPRGSGTQAAHDPNDEFNAGFNSP